MASATALNMVGAQPRGGDGVGKGRGGEHVRAHQLDDNPVGGLQPQHRFAKLARWPLNRHLRHERASQPVADTGRRHGKGDFRGLAMPGAPARACLPDQKTDDAAGAGRSIALKQMQLRAIGVTGGLLDQPQAQKGLVEIRIGLNPRRDRRDMVDAAGHGLRSLFLFRSNHTAPRR